MALEQFVHRPIDVAVPVPTAKLLKSLVNRPAAAGAVVSGARPFQSQHSGGYLLKWRRARVAGTRASEEILIRNIHARQATPRDDIISRLSGADLEEEDGSTRRLTAEEIAAFCRVIVFAGSGTTWRQLGATIFALLSDKEQFEIVRNDRSLVQNAILESTRWFPNDPLFVRKAKRDTTLQGVNIPKGAIMHLCLGAANRDPTRWDDPDRFDVRRPVQRSLAFAAGPHSCLGQHVAREEMGAALNALLDRFPNLRWDPSKPPPKLSGGLLARAPDRLPVLLH